VETEITNELLTTYTPEEVADNLSLEFLEQDYGSLITQIKKLDDEASLLKKAILIKFEKTYGHQGYTFENPDTHNKLQRILQVTTDYDQAKLKKYLPPSEYEAITTQVVDKDKVIAAIRVGLVNPVMIQDAITTREIDKLAWRQAKK